jgi:hypothetical protein
MPYVIRLWFGTREPVNRTAYAVSGVALMLVKYLVEALMITAYSAVFWMPWHFANPLMSMRLKSFPDVPEWVWWASFGWSIPFFWIAMTMSVRRAADAGQSPWLGLLVLVPVFNLVFMLLLSALPSKERHAWLPSSEQPRREQQARDAAFALCLSLIVGMLMMAVSVYLLRSYGAALFVGTPLMMGVVAGYAFNRMHARDHLFSASLGGLAIVIGALTLLLFALEGVICIAMALPLLLPLGAFGGLLGKAIADTSRRPPHELLAAVLMLPALAFAETQLVAPTDHVVMSAIEIDAPPEVVWTHVLQFPELPPPAEWHFRLGIACPERAKINGTGVGAVRHCEFTTGVFVEPITAWEPGERLAFDVTEQPAPMFELTPYRHVHPPHLDGYLRSQRGEFRLIALPGGRTRLEGRTWYEMAIFPDAYWSMWSTPLIHSIHHRVLRHIKHCAEAAQS